MSLERLVRVQEAAEQWLRLDRDEQIVFRYLTELNGGGPANKILAKMIIEEWNKIS